MASAKKVTSVNHLPAVGDGRFPVYSKQFNELVDVVNDLSGADGTLQADTISEETSGTGVTVDGVLLKDSDVTLDDLIIGDDVTFTKEVAHTLIVDTSTTAATAGGLLTLTAGAGATSGAGGALSVIGGAGGTTGTGGAIAVTSGAGGATSGASGVVNIKTGNATVGSSGQINISSGDTASGLAGDVVLTTGSSTATVTVPVVVVAKGMVRKPTSTNVATGATATVVGLISGCLNVTGATGNVTLPTGTLISDAIGSVTAGTHFDFIVNTIGMTAGNVATIVVDAGVVTAKQVSSGDSATDQLLTVTNTSNVNIGIFRLVNIAANSWSLHRIA